MSLFYRSERVGKDGKPFSMLKLKTLRDGTKTSYKHDTYLPLGRFLRKYRIDEIPQLWQVITRRMNLVGPRPQEAKTLKHYPKTIREKLLSVRPGMFGLAGIYFMDEEKLLALSLEPEEDYFKKILPLKLALDMFYIENKCFSLDVWIVWQGIKSRLCK